MDRLNRSLFFTCGLLLVLAATGCRSTHSEVPPGRRYMNDGREVPPVSFSSDPRPTANSGFAGGMPGAMPGTQSPYAAPPANMAGSSMSNYGVPTSTGSFGPAATSVPMPSQTPGSSASLGVPSAGAQ